MNRSRSFVLALALALAAAGLALPLAAADLTQLVAGLAKYESGMPAGRVQEFEQLVRDSASQPALRAALEPALIKLLAPESSFEAKRFACQQLAAIGSGASLPALAGLLNHQETAGMACLALGAQRSPKAAAILRHALASAKGAARLQIVTALGNQRDGQAVKALLPLARDPDAVLASAAIFALGKIGGAEAHGAIAAMRRETKPALAAALAEATLYVAEQLAAAGDRKGSAALYEELLAPSRPAHVRSGAFAALLPLEADGGEKRILDVLHDRSPLLKPVAIRGIGALKSAGASAKFAAELPKLPAQEQAWLIDSLAARADAAALDAIRRAVGSGEAIVRSSAVAALARLNDSGSAGLLCAALGKAQTPGEREEIANALGQLRGAAADAAIFGEVKRASGDAKRELIGLVGRRGNQAAVPVLLEQAGSEDAAIARAAFQALGKVAAEGDFAGLLDGLVNLKAPEARSEAEIAAGRVMLKLNDPARRSEAVLARLAQCSGIPERGSLLQLLPRAGDAKALAALKSAASDANPALRDAAVRVMAAWPDDGAWEPLMGICRKPESPTHRALAYRGLVRLAGDRNAKADAVLIARYGELLSLAGDPGESKLVLGSLAGAASADALPLALGQLATPAVRAEAVAAVKKIAAAIQPQNPQAAQEALKQVNLPK